MTGGYAFRDEDERDMTMRRSIGWVAAGAGTLAGVVALAFFLGHWHLRSLDEHGRALVAAEQYDASAAVVGASLAGPGLACRNAALLGITGPIRSRGQD